MLDVIGFDRRRLKVPETLVSIRNLPRLLHEAAAVHVYTIRRERAADIDQYSGRISSGLIFIAGRPGVRSICGCSDRRRRSAGIYHWLIIPIRTPASIHSLQAEWRRQYFTTSETGMIMKLPRSMHIPGGSLGTAYNCPRPLRPVYLLPHLSAHSSECAIGLSPSYDSPG